MEILLTIAKILLIIPAIALVLAFWAGLLGLIVAVVVALFTASISSFGTLLGILIGVLALIYIIGMTSVI